MNYLKSKRVFTQKIISLFDYPWDYTPIEIECTIREFINSQFLSRPEYQPDHLRVALIEFGYLERTKDGSIYRVCPDFENVKDIYPGERRKVLSSILDNSKEQSLKCLRCEEFLSPKELLRHFDKHHSSEAGQYRQRKRKLSNLWPYLKR